MTDRELPLLDACRRAPRDAGWMPEQEGRLRVTRRHRYPAVPIRVPHVSTGVDPADARMPGRALQLSDAQALAYRVRAVHADDTVPPWTEPVRVGTQLRATRP